VVTSNRDASEWLPLMTDPLLAQSAIDRLTSTCHELIVEGDSYRRRQRPAPPVDDPAPAVPSPVSRPRLTGSGPLAAVSH
jgi:IstB-like ATP binding protein